MPVIGLDYRKIHAEKDAVLPKVNISTSPRIIDIKKTKLTGFGSDFDVLSVDFEFSSKFEPKAGDLSIEGTIIYKADDADSIMKLWKKEKKLPANANSEIVNYIFSKVGIFALQISDALQMPPVIGMPRIKSADEPEKK